ncbi:hypothetical protein FLSA109164_03690 [Flavobacterium saliperosum]|uniref:Uncharacterized protein n=1 Tax=Flavobacterium saliperosum TaxID=329186 RepID=A0A1G4W084_9FLAO|nr:hypothetical protein SAMN02927925_02117 [Flavobacterium saliperosum]
MLLRYCIKFKAHTMAKLYSKKTKASPKMLPKKETISFLLSYSKALTITKVGDLTFENIAN